ncbi:MAG: hypothetical protein RL385_4168 [Pseudomonadota bacterium]|jgi:hypothetical protein
MRRKAWLGWIGAATCACSAVDAESPEAGTAVVAGPDANVAVDAGGTEDAIGAMGEATVVEAAALPGATNSTDAGMSGVDAGQTSSAVQCAAPAVCTDFEDGTRGLPPGYRIVSPNCSGDGSAQVDTAFAHSGTHALKVQSGGGYCNHVFVAPAQDLGPFQANLWVRFYVRLSAPLSASHVTLLAMHDGETDKDLRMGGQNQILMWNRERDDATLPELSPNGTGQSVALVAARFQCVEFHLAGDAGQLETFVDGARVSGLVVDDAPTADIDAQWLRAGPFRAKVSDVRFGWESYGGDPMTLWFDDIVVGSERSGC